MYHSIKPGKRYLFTSGTSGYFPNRSDVCVFDDCHGEYRSLGDPHVGDRRALPGLPARHGAERDHRGSRGFAEAQREHLRVPLRLAPHRMGRGEAPDPLAGRVADRGVVKLFFKTFASYRRNGPSGRSRSEARNNGAVSSGEKKQTALSERLRPPGEHFSFIVRPLLRASPPSRIRPPVLLMSRAPAEAPISGRRPGPPAEHGGFRPGGDLRAGGRRSRSG